MTPKTVFRLLTSIAILLFLTGCISAGPVKPLPSFAPTNFDSGNYASKVDNFIVIVDASSSMGDSYAGNKKLVITKTFVDRMNQDIPQLGQNAGLRSFGHAPSVSGNNTELFYGMKKYSTSDLAEGLDKITSAGGCSPLYTALAAAENDLEALGGNKVIILVSDGQRKNMIVPNTLEYAQKLKDKFGDSICIYTIVVGDSVDGTKLLSDIANIGGCGFSANADSLLASQPMADFVEKVFLTKKGKPAPKPKKVKKVKPVKKAKKDSDKDGVWDENDLCPNTPVGAQVNVKGCWSFGDALFDTNKASIKQNAFALLNNAYKIFEKNPDMSVTLKGHTDNRGTDAYNMDLSQRRAESVKAYLVNQGIDSARLTCKAYGESSPIAANDTDQGRALNRRVELSPDK
jgi:OmpA-OmpF porin, OOP family